MNENFQFQRLVELCRVTHEEMQQRAGRSVDIALVVRNWLFGWYIVEFEQQGADRAEYGNRLIPRLSEELKQLLGRGFSDRNLETYRKFYLTYRSIPRTLSAELPKKQLHATASLQKISQTVSAISHDNRWKQLSHLLTGKFSLSWSHYVILLTIDSLEERQFYEIEAMENSWSIREMERQIASSLYERLALSRNKEEIRRLSQQGLVLEKAADFIKNPMVLEFLGLEEKPSYSEGDLERAIISKLESFLLELGKGFLFEARQKRFTFDNDHFYVDLVFYNRLLRSYVLIDLKRDKLTHQDLGQMQMYVNYFDRYVKSEEEGPTIGIVLCHRKNDALVELTLPKENNIYASKYQLYLPSKEELKAQLLYIEMELDAQGMNEADKGG